MRDAEEDDDDPGMSNPEDNSSGTEENDDNEENAIDPALLRNFDRNKPTTHEYLGKLENISGYTLYEHGQILELPAIYTKTLVFPGFTLPLVLSDQHGHNFEIGHNFVLIWMMNAHDMFFEYGVVMEVFERSADRNETNVKAKGRQRCYIMPQQLSINSYRQLRKAKVMILEETPISSPLSCTQLDTLRRKFPYKGDYRNKSAFYRYRRMHLGQFTFPHWVYDLYEVDYYVDWIIKLLTKYHSEEDIPKDATQLSYWFGQNFQLMNSERLMLLQCNTTLERLQLALKYLHIERNLCCAHCNTVISHQRDVFAMSKEGLQSNYVNPGGVVYETVTVRKIQHFIMTGQPCEDFSWFPGYAWTIGQCEFCGGHLGWRFTSKKLTPPKFYGLARSCLKITTRKSGDGQQGDDEAMDSLRRDGGGSDEGGASEDDDRGGPGGVGGERRGRTGRRSIGGRFITFLSSFN